MTENIYHYLAKVEDHGLGTLSYGNYATIDLSDRIIPDRTISSLRIPGAYIPQIIYNIIDQPLATPYPCSNNQLDFVVAGNPQSIILPEGQYDKDSILDSIMNLFNAAYVGTHVMVTDWDSQTFLTTLSVEDILGVPTVFSMTATSTNAPTILRLLGYTDDPSAYTGASSYLSEGPLNVFQDRLLMVTCDEIQGRNTSFDSLAPELWHEGILSDIPLVGAKGDITTYKPANSSIWVAITAVGTTKIFTLRLVREKYPIFGPSVIDWTLSIDVR